MTYRPFVVHEYHEARCVVCPVDPDLEDCMARRLLRTHYCETSWECGPTVDTTETPEEPWICGYCHTVFTPEQIAQMEATAQLVEEEQPEPEEPDPEPYWEPWEPL